MWVFSKYGFYSVVRSNVDPSMMIVRSRERGHLEALKSKMPTHLEGTEIIESLDTDYRFRMIVPNAIWVRVVCAIAGDIDYPNFKHQVTHDDSASDAYVSSLYDVWDAVFMNYTLRMKKN